MALCEYAPAYLPVMIRKTAIGDRAQEATRHEARYRSRAASNPSIYHGYQQHPG